ncbi:MAG TPA: hypothetical protein VG028_09400 [Terriglobia bacterium]|nr:hypothetical protein [Terriglobia bacterium]
MTGLVSLIGLSLAPSGFARRPNPSITLKVGVYNYAEIGGLEKREAEGEASRLFDRAGVRIVWVDCALTQEEIALHPQCSNPDVVLRFLPASMTTRLDEHAEALGQSIGWGGNGRAWSANVFYARVLELSSSWNLDPAQVLGDAAAHELGHLLLGPGHARTGIMLAVWSPLDLRRASQGGLKFTEGEMALLKDAVNTLRSKPAPVLASRNE